MGKPPQQPKSEPAKTSKGTYEYDSLKNPQKYLKNFGQKICSKKISRHKIFEKPLFLAIFGRKFDKSSEPIELFEKSSRHTIKFDDVRPWSP